MTKALIIEGDLQNCAECDIWAWSDKGGMYCPIKNLECPKKGIPDWCPLKDIQIIDKPLLKCPKCGVSILIGVCDDD